MGGFVEYKRKEYALARAWLEKHADWYPEVATRRSGGNGARVYMWCDAQVIADRLNARVRRQHLPGRVTAAEIDTLPGFCAYCLDRTHLVIDHVVPVSRGGGGGIENLAVACVSCNSAGSGKGTRLLEEWVQPCPS